MKSKFRWLTMTVALVACLASVAAAAVPGVIPYQGRLTNAAGTPQNGSFSIQFALFAAATGGSALWTETQPTVTVANGLFNVNLGSVTAFPATLFSGGELYLEIKVGADPVMTPRQRLGSVAYAQRTGLSPGVATASRSSFIDASGTENITSVTATFPGPGYAFVHGQVYVAAFHVNGTNDQVGVSMNTTSGVMAGIPYIQRWNVDASLPNVGFQHQNILVATRVFPVSAGPQTFYFVGEENAGNIRYWWAHMTVMYVPDAIGPLGEPNMVVEDAGASVATPADR